MNTITIELCAEDRARLDAILKALTHTHDCNSCVEQVIRTIDPLMQSSIADTEAAEQPQEPAKEPAQPVTPPEVEQPAETTTETPESEQTPTVDRSEVQRKVVELSAAGKKAEVKEIVMAYADRVSTIPEDKLAEVFDKLSALEG